MLHEFAPPGEIDVLGPAHGDGLYALVSHDGAAAEPAGAGPALLDGRGEHPIFPGQTDGGHLGVGLIQFLPYEFLRFRARLCPASAPASRISTLSLWIQRYTSLGDLLRKITLS